MTDLELLQHMDKQGDLCGLPGKPADKPPLYQRLRDRGWIKRNVAHGASVFHDITSEGRAVLESPETVAAGIAALGREEI